MEENPEVITRIRDGRGEVRIQILGKDNDDITYTIALFDMDKEKFYQLEEKREQKQCEICRKKFENIDNLYITAYRLVMCIRCASPSYIKVLQNKSNSSKKDSEIYIEDDPSVDKTYFLLKAKRQCKTCDITFKKEEELETHNKSMGYGHGLLQCETCNEAFKTKENLEFHKIFYHEKRCDTCNITINRYDLENHNESVHGHKKTIKMEENQSNKNIEIKCEPCDMIVENKEGLIVHDKSMHTPKTCDKTEEKEKELQIHKLRDHNESHGHKERSSPIIKSYPTDNDKNDQIEKTRSPKKLKRRVIPRIKVLKKISKNYPVKIDPGKIINDNKDSNDKEEISGKEDENFPIQKEFNRDHNTYKDKEEISGKEDENFPIQKEFNRDHNTYNDKEEINGKKDENFPIKKEFDSDHNTYNDKEEISGKKNENFPITDEFNSDHNTYNDKEEINGKIAKMIATIDMLCRISNVHKEYDITKELIRIKNDPTKNNEAKWTALRNLLPKIYSLVQNIREDKEEISGKKNDPGKIINDKEEISGKEDENFPIQKEFNSDHNTYNDKEETSGKEDENFPIQKESNSDHNTYNDKEEINGKKDENFPGQNDRNDYNEKEKINGKKDNNLPVKNDKGKTNKDHSDHNDKQEISGKKDEKFPFQTEHNEISGEDEKCLHPNIKNHRKDYSDKEEIYGKKDNNFPLDYSDKKEINGKKDNNFPLENNQDKINNDHKEFNAKEEISGKKDENPPGQNDRNEYNDKEKVNGKKDDKFPVKNAKANKLRRKKKENETESMEYLYKNYSLLCTIYSLLGIIAIIILSVNNILVPAEIERGKFTSIYPSPAQFRIWEKSKFNDIAKGAQYKSESNDQDRLSQNVKGALIRRDQLIDPNSVINDQGKLSQKAKGAQHKSESNDQGKLSQKAKGAQYKSESNDQGRLSQNVKGALISKDQLTDPNSVINDQGKLSQKAKGAQYKSESVINDSDQIHRSRSSHSLFALGLSWKKGNTVNERGEYILLLLIIFYLLSFPRESIVQINARGGSNLFLPTNCKTLHTQTFPSVSHKKSNYHRGSNSTYRNVCQFTESLRSATYIIWSNSKYYNVYEFTRLSLLGSRFISGKNHNHSSTIHEIFNLICPYGIQWPSNEYATHQEILTKSKIQWPPEKVATMWTVANSN